MATDDRPIITCAGNQSLFATVHPYMVDALPMQKTDWQRSYGRPVKKVRLCGHFVPFDVHQLPRRFDESRLLKDPILHLYWIDCDIDTYKRKVRDDLFMWQSALKALSIPDWLIIVVVHDENKVKTKILRTSVYDKVKSEFGSRNSGRCVLFSEPLRNDPKSEAWTIVISRIQKLMLASFSRIISKFEDAMRLERERRTEHDWTFTKYFMLQESLAKFYSSIELCEDALVQYDELDALFAQFIVNHSVGAKADWLISYSELSSGWEGVSMSTDVNLYRRLLISEGKPSLLDLRNYMFSRQCGLLIDLERPSELTSRSLKFIHNTIHELRLLEVAMPPGAVSCWVFLTCKELLAVCESFKESLGMKCYSIYTSHLWTCLQSVTHKLGCLCGLMPGSEPTSAELHFVVQLISGISHSSSSMTKDTNELTPQARLKRVLTSKDDFCSYYVELTELTVGTLKYIGHTRMATLLGQQLAKFYMSSAQPQQAEPFLLNCLQLFSNHLWTSLELDTWAQLADCEQMIGNHAAYLRACLKVASHGKASLEKRLQLLDRVKQFSLPSPSSSSTREAVTVVENCAMSVTSIDLKRDVTAGSATIRLHLHSNLPGDLEYEALSLLIKPNIEETDEQKPTQRRRGSPFQFIPLTQYSEERDGGELAVGLTCANTHSLLTLKDSHNSGHMIRNLSKNNVELGQEEREMAASLPAGKLEGGENCLVFTLEEPAVGEFRIYQIRIQSYNMDLFVDVLNCQFTIQGTDIPSVRITSPESACGCFMGVSNSIQAVITNSQQYKQPQVSSSQADITALCRQPAADTDNDTSSETFQLHLVPSSSVVGPGSKTIKLDFTFEGEKGERGGAVESLVVSQTVECHCPIEIKRKLLTAKQQKYIQISVFSLVRGRKLCIRSPLLAIEDGDGEESISFVNLCGPADTLWGITNSSQLSFLWRLETSSGVTYSDSIKCSFSIEFCEDLPNVDQPTEFNTFSTHLNVDMIKTQFIMTRYIKSGIPMSPLSLSRQSSQEHGLSSSPFSLPLQPTSNTWQALCECEMVVELQACSDLELTEDEAQSQKISYEIKSDPNWAISGNKQGLLELTSHTLLSSIGIKLMPLASEYLHLPEVRLRNANNEEFLPGQVYDNSKLTQVFINGSDQ